MHIDNKSEVFAEQCTTHHCEIFKNINSICAKKTLTNEFACNNKICWFVLILVRLLVSLSAINVRPFDSKRRLLFLPPTITMLNKKYQLSVHIHSNNNCSS